MNTTTASLASVRAGVRLKSRARLSSLCGAGAGAGLGVGVGVGVRGRFRSISCVEYQNHSQSQSLLRPSCRARNTREQSTTSSPSSSSSSSSASTHKPSHPGLIRVVHSPHAYASWAESLVNLPAGAHFASFEDARPVRQQRYSTVQVGTGSTGDGSAVDVFNDIRNSANAKHIELNSDLRFANHSCDPSLVFDTARMEARVVDERALRVGDELTFFYPSTEWEMDRPFECQCRQSRNRSTGLDVDPDEGKGKDKDMSIDKPGSRKCKGWIAGAKALSASNLKGYWVNEHIREMLEQRERRGVE